MTGHRHHKVKKIISLGISLSLVIALSLLFGQVLGNLYLDNLAEDLAVPGTGATTGGSNGSKIKVLRLKPLTYYTINVAGFSEYEQAIEVGKILAEQKLPAVITGSSPHYVRLGFLNNAGQLARLAQRITVDGQKAEVSEADINSISFKFPENDSYAAEVLAPFIGEVSLSLEKALILNRDLDCTSDEMKRLKPMFGELGQEVLALASRGTEIAAQLAEIDSPHTPYLRDLAAALYNWGQSLKELDAINWNNNQLLYSQQQTLVVIEEYQRLLQTTNLQDKR